MPRSTNPKATDTLVQHGPEKPKNVAKQEPAASPEAEAKQPEVIDQSPPMPQDLEAEASALRTRLESMGNLDEEIDNINALQKTNTERTKRNQQLADRVGDLVQKLIDNGDLPEGATVADAVKLAEEQAAAEPEAAKTPEAKKQKIYIAVGQAEKAEHGEDSILRIDEERLFGVFDGAGGGGGDPKVASNAANLGVRASYAKLKSAVKTVPEAINNMITAFDSARKYTDQNGEGGITTAAAVKLELIDNRPVAILGNAGDSKVMIFDKDGNLKFETEEQCVGRGLLNCIGQGVDGSKDFFTAVHLSTGDRIIIGTDGIFGDTAEQRLTDEDFAQILAEKDAQTASEKAIEVSKKIDDKSALVIDVLGYEYVVENFMLRTGIDNDGDEVILGSEPLSKFQDSLEDENGEKPSGVKKVNAADRPKTAATSRRTVRLTPGSRSPHARGDVS